MILKSFFIVMVFLIAQGQGMQLDKAQPGGEEKRKTATKEAYDKISAGDIKAKGYFYRVALPNKDTQTGNSDCPQKPQHYVYVVGVLHQLPEEFLPAGVIEAIADSKTLVIETPLLSAVDIEERKKRPSLHSFAGFKREELESLNLLWVDASSWTEKLSPDQLQAIQEGIGADAKAAWGLDLNELHPALVKYLAEESFIEAKRLSEVRRQKLFNVCSERRGEEGLKHSVIVGSLKKPLGRGREPMLMGEFIIEEFLKKAVVKPETQGVADKYSALYLTQQFDKKEVIGLENGVDRLKAELEAKGELGRLNDPTAWEEVIKTIPLFINSVSSANTEHTSGMTETETDVAYLESYLEGNLEKVKSSSQSSDYAVCHLRTSKWLPKIKALIRRKPPETFLIEVGVLHVPRILEYLKEEGHTIEKGCDILNPRH